jgi:hypothetical protein
MDWSPSPSIVPLFSTTSFEKIRPHRSDISVLALLFVYLLDDVLVRCSSVRRLLPHGCIDAPFWYWMNVEFRWLLIWLLQFIRNIHVNAHGESVVEATVGVLDRQPTKGSTRSRWMWLAEIGNSKEETRGTQFRQVRAARCVIPYVLYAA